MERRLRILQVEDDPADGELMTSALVADGFGCEVVRVDTREAFLAALDSEEFDLILSDFSLPAFDGLTALALARAHRPEVPFVFVSGTLGEERAIEALLQGATDYVLKDRLSGLVPAVRRALRERAEHKARREAEEALEQEQQLLKTVLDNIEAGVAACDARGVLTLFNRTLREWHGRAGEPLPPEQRPPHYGLFRTDGRTPLATEELPLMRALRGENVRNVEVVIAPPGGTARTVLASAEAMFDAHGQKVGAVLVAHDITERLKAEQELARQREALHQSEKLGAMASLVAGVAHELNNPLSVAMGQASLLRQAAGEGPLALRADKIVKAAERCARIVRNFLALARQQPRQRQRVDLNQIVRETLEMLSYHLRVDGVELALVLDPDLPVLWADAHELQQVLLNLVANAQQAMRQSPRRAIAIRTSLDRGGERVHLSVGDSGPGVPPEIRTRIFEPFFTTKPPGEGTGLGLSLCQGIVAEHGGLIRVEGEAGQGATFRVELPVAPPEGGPEELPPPAPAKAPRGRILVVDDEPEMREMLAELLMTEGHVVDTASGGSVALEKLRRGSYDVVLCDLKMPGLDGPGLNREVERERPEISRRFVFMTGDTLSPLAREFLERRGAPTLSKPFDMRELRRVLEAILERRAGGRGGDERT